MFAWGCGSCLGCGSSETTSLRPRFIEDLSITKIIDISCGDSHCLALTHGKKPPAVNSLFLFFLVSIDMLLWMCSYREWSVCLGEQHHGPMWARPHLNTDYQTQEGARSGGGVDPANHCRHFPQPCLDRRSNWPVKKTPKCVHLLMSTSAFFVIP